LEITDNFLQNDMIDLGAGAYPTLGDVDGDGLDDLLVSNRKRFDVDESYTSRLHFFKNTGTSTEPEFTYLDTNFLNIPSLQWQNIHPSLGDLNGDGSPDLVVGDLMGNLHYFANTTSGGNVAFTLSTLPLMDETGEMIDVGQSATPQVFDVDNDGLNDLLVGSLNGGVAYYRNTGTNQAASFTWVTDSLGQAVASSLLGIQGKSVPCMYRNAEGTNLLLGTEPGNIMSFSGIDGNLSGVFTLDTEDFNHIREGARTAPAMGDLNGDQIQDLIIGNTGGGLAYWQHLPTGVRESPISEIEIFPNPQRLELQVVQVLFGILLVGVGSGLYLTCNVGPGTRDGLMTGLNARTGVRVGRARTFVEVSALTVGWLLGGVVGIGTLLFALLVGQGVALAFGLVERLSPEVKPLD
jgi:hypothetical protein